jgi:predicted CXXCH cytochrome family protein
VAFNKITVTKRILTLAFFISVFLLNNEIKAQDFNCADCHDVSIAKSVHNGIIECQDCHTDVKDEEHIEKGVKKVQCGNCHEDIAKIVSTDIHHRLKTKVKNPPECVTCHGNHEIKTPPTTSQQKVKDICSKCHTSMSLVTNFHKTEITSENKCYTCHKSVNVKINLPSSVHKNLVCSDCHSNFKQFLTDHSKNLKKTQIADCTPCHSEIAKQHRESIHGIALREGIDEAANCWDCHGHHDVKHVKSESSTVNPKNVATTCAKCHDNPELAKKFDFGVPNPGKRYSSSVHGKLIQSGNTNAATCNTCHGTHDIKNKVQPGSKISTFNIPDLCGQCHKQEAEDYKQSIHWIRAKQGFREAPVCDDCHSEHGINAINSTNQRAMAKKIQEETCMVCHQNPRIAERFGHSGSQAKMYQDSYHGLAVMRGDKDAAMCIDCHSVHKILPQDHPESSVNPANVTATCKKCHPEATPVFSQSYSHETQNKAAAKIENVVSNIYFWMIISVIGGMILHNLLIFAYEIKKKRNRMLGEITIPRFTKNEVIQHLLLLISFITLAITGFALKYNQSWWAEMLRTLGLSETVRQYIHRGAAVVMIAVGLYHVIYLIFTARGRDVLVNLIPKWSDVVEARDNILYYLRIKKTKPKFDKYDYTEKAEYWALIWGTIVMGATGFVLWFPTVVGDWAPTWLIKVSELIHFYEAILATLAILVWHWFFVIFHPHEYPMSLTWMDGKMTLHTYRHHHEKHFRRVVLEWKEYKAGKRDLKKVSNSTMLFTSTLEKNGLNPDSIIDTELSNDAELREWLEKKINPIPVNE